jgi:hypothetical protein
MSIVKKESYLYFEPENLNLEFFDSILQAPVSNDLIIDLSSFETLQENDLSVLLKVNDKIHSKGFCMVVVLIVVPSFSDVESLNVVPTLIEAEDYIQMEQIQRDLGGDL